MADYQFPGQNQWSDKPVIGTGEGESPLAPAPQNEMTVRTMASDVASMKEMGGGEPRPYKPSETVQQAIPTPDTAQQAVPQNNIINPIQTAEVPVVPLPEKKNGNLFIIIAGIIIVLGLVAIGYFYVYPKFAPSGTPDVAVEIPQVPIVVATTTETTSTIEVPPVTGLGNHVSLFKTAADFSSEASLTAETTDAIKETWKGTTVEVPVFRETVFKNASGTILGSSQLASLFLPSTINATTSKLFEEDFTLFTYTNQKGVWPGMILRAKPETLASAKEAIKNIEANTEWKSLFITDPGKEQTWKDGKVGTMTARYISFSTQGNALSYTWFDNVVLISTNYQGAQDAAKKLGF